MAQTPMKAETEKQDEASSGPNPYAGIVKEILATEDLGASEKDNDALVAALAAELMKQGDYAPGSSQEPFFDQARQLMWRWKDKKAAEARKSGKEEYSNCSPETICD